MYTKVFGLDVPLTQSQPTRSTQGTHRIPSTPRSPNPKMDTSESNPVPIVVKADETILQDTLQVSLAEHKSREEQEARENVELVNKHLASKEIEKMMEGSENVIDDSLSPRNDEPNILGTRLRAQGVIRKSRGSRSSSSVCARLILERQKIKEEMEQMIAKAVLQERGIYKAKIFSQIQKAIDNHIPSQVDALVRSYMSGHILHVHPVQSQTPSVPEQQYQLIPS
ncbi:hypothetical protein Tco_0602053 [Tanacetum coccineum]